MTRNVITLLAKHNLVTLPTQASPLPITFPDFTVSI